MEEALPAPDPQHLCGGMLRAEADSTPSRRHVLAALSRAALAGGALVVAMPSEGPAIPIIEPDADAELLAMIARFDAIERHIWGPEGPDTIAEEEAWQAANKPLEAEQKALLQRICSTPTYTMEGLQARARSLLLWDAGAQFEADGPDDYPDDCMVTAILRGLAGEVRV